MTSLTKHFVAAHEHGRLPFHSACPICRAERLSGSLPDDALLSPRTRSGTAAALLAAGALISPVGALADPVGDSEQEGQAAPDNVPGGDSAQQIDFDPGGADSELPADATPTEPPGGPQPAQPPTADSDTGDQAETPEAEPERDDEALRADGSEETSGDATEPAPAPPAPAPPTPMAPSAEAPAQPNGDQLAPAKPRQPHAKRHHPRPKATLGGNGRPPAPRPPINPTAAPLRAADVTPRVSAVAINSSGADDQSPSKGERFHLVVAGESLWSIASDLLGPRANPAAIARQVDRLWRLNAARIATGNRDLLLVGTRLRLR